MIIWLLDLKINIFLMLIKHLFNDKLIFNNFINFLWKVLFIKYIKINNDYK
jgi:uncharacterized protein YjaG (DUF416 family)